MAAPLLSLIADGRREARPKTAMCGPGDAAGVKLGTNPVVTDIGERGKRPTLPSRTVGFGGQARRPLLASGRDGVAVVLRGREAGHMGKGDSVIRSLEEGEEVDAE